MLVVFVACSCMSVVASAQAERVSPKGKVLSVSRGAIAMSDADGKTYTIKFREGQNVVQVVGNLSAEMLKPGMIVRFSGKLKGNALDGEISELKIYTPADGYQLGILQDDPAQDATVTGQLTKHTKGLLNVAAGRKRITARLAEGAEVLVDSKDYSIAKAGDKIEAEGTVANDGTVTARKALITVGVQPAEAEEKPGPKKKTK